MQWDDSPNAGFAVPDVKDLWLPLAPDYKEKNVETELLDPRSMLNFFRNLLALRKASPALVNRAAKPRAAAKAKMKARSSTLRWWTRIRSNT